MAQSSELRIIDNSMVGRTSPVCDVEVFFQALSVGLADSVEMLIPNFFDLILRKCSLLDEFLGIEVIDWRSLTDSLIHHWLSEA